MSTHFRCRIGSSVAGGKGDQKAPEGRRSLERPRLLPCLLHASPPRSDSMLASALHRGAMGALEARLFARVEPPPQ